MNQPNNNFNSSSNTPRFNIITRFFCWCAGAELGILRRCPTEVNKYVGMGAVVLFTGVLAIISFSFAIRTLIQNMLLIIPMSIFWGMIIFNLDRYIVSTMRKNNEPIREFFIALPRIILAIMIALVIAKPLEIELVRNQIEGEKKMMNSKISKKYIADKSDKVNVLQQEIKTIDEQVIQLNQSKDIISETDRIADVSVRVNKAKEELDDIKINNRPEITKAREEIEIIKGRSIGTELDTVRNIQIAIYSAADEARLIFLKNKVRKLNSEIYQKRKIYDRNYKYRGDAVGLRIAEINDEIAELKQRREEKKKSLEKEEEKVAAEFGIDQPTLSTSLIGIFGDIKVLGEIKNNNSAIWWGSLAIIFLFILLETAPVFVKLFLPRGIYDEILNDHEKELHNKSRSHINTNMQIQNAKNSDLVAIATARTNDINELLQIWSRNEDGLKERHGYELNNFLSQKIPDYESSYQELISRLSLTNANYNAPSLPFERDSSNILESVNIPKPVLIGVPLLALLGILTWGGVKLYDNMNKDIILTKKEYPITPPIDRMENKNDIDNQIIVDTTQDKPILAEDREEQKQIVQEVKLDAGKQGKYTKPDKPSNTTSRGEDVNTRNEHQGPANPPRENSKAITNPPASTSSSDSKEQTSEASPNSLQVEGDSTNNSPVSSSSGDSKEQTSGDVQAPPGVEGNTTPETKTNQTSKPEDTQDFSIENEAEELIPEKSSEGVETVLDFAKGVSNRTHPKSVSEDDSSKSTSTEASKSTTTKDETGAKAISPEEKINPGSEQKDSIEVKQKQ